MIAPKAEREILAGVRSPLAADRTRAFERLVASVHRPLFAVCESITQHRADAEDALQEAYVAAHRGLAGFRGDSRLGTWMYRIAIRAALRQRARRRRRADHALASEPIDPRTLAGPENVDAERVRRALGRLSAEHRTVLALFCVEDHSHEEIAEVLGVPVGTAWSRLHHARKRLVAEFEQQRDC